MLRKRSLQVNFTEGEILPAMLRFAMPVLFSLVFQQLYNTTDTIIIGHTLGEVSLAAMGSASAVYDLYLAIITGMAGGIAIVSARNWGCRDHQQLKRTVAASLVIGTATALLMTILASVTLMPFLKLLNTPDEVIGEAYSYISVISSFYLITMGYNLCSRLLRAIGNSLMPLIFLIISSAANVALDFFCIVGLKMGIRGAAVATVLAQLLSMVLCVFYILRHVPLLVPKREDFRFDGRLYRDIVTQGLSMGLMTGIVMSGTAILQSAINGLGYLVIAGHVAARKLGSLLNMISMSIMEAISSFVSQNYGANQGSRIRKGVKIAYLFNSCVFIVLTVTTWAFTPEMIRSLSGSSEPVILNNGTRYLHFVMPCYPIVGILSATRTSLQAIGQKILPVLSSVIELFGKIAFVYLLIPVFGYDAVIVCEPVIWVLMNIELLISFWNNPYIRKSRTPGILG